MEITTTDTGTGWNSRADLSAIGADASVVGVALRYWFEAVNETDEILRYWHASCANSQVDHTGGFVDDSETGRRCVAVDCDAWPTFRGECWKPGASRFQLNPVASADPHTLPTDSQWWNRFFSDQCLKLVQGAPGNSSHRNISITRVGGPSLGMIIGGFRDDVPRSGGVAADEPLFVPTMGTRQIDSAGRQYVETGLWQARKNHNGASGVLLATAPLGAAVVADDEWADRTGDGGLLQRMYPRGNSGGTRVSGYTGTANRMTSRCQLSDSTEQLHVPGNAVGAKVTAIDTAIRAWAVGL
jgi:hypothetical protein